MHERMASDSFGALKPGRHSKQRSHAVLLTALKADLVCELNAMLRSNGHHNSRPNAGNLLNHRQPETENGFSAWKPLKIVGRFIFPFGDDLLPDGRVIILGIWMSGSALNLQRQGGECVNLTILNYMVFHG